MLISRRSPKLFGVKPHHGFEVVIETPKEETSESPKEFIEPPKTKRKAAPKKIKVEDINEEIKEEEPKEEPKKTKTVELVECPKCKKQLPKRTLRYDHE